MRDLTLKILYAPAKTNRTLYIKEFSEAHQKHELESVMQKISLCDEIEISEISEKNILTVTGKFAEGVPSDERNIVLKSIDFFFEKNQNISQFYFDITLIKNIPNEAGLGGGSSNAAEIIKFLHKKYDIKLEPKDYISLGSDVPFFLENFECGLVTGVGETLTPSPSPRGRGGQVQNSEDFGVLIFPENIKVSTAWAFGEFKNFRKNQKKQEEIFGHDKSVPLRKNSKVSSRNKNDFTEILCQKIPEISHILGVLEKISEQYKISEYGISGSGSTMYVLFSTEFSQQKFLENFQKLCSIPTILQVFSAKTS